MTVIAWDGKTLAADKQTNRGDAIGTCTKIFKLHDGTVVSFCGALSKGLVLFDWYRNGCKEEEWPEFQKSDSVTILVVVKDGKCIEYEGVSNPISCEDEFSAWGSGMEFAIGAMAMGATAVEAVEIASYHCEGCGRGVDSFDVSSQKK